MVFKANELGGTLTGRSSIHHSPFSTPGARQAAPSLASRKSNCSRQKQNPGSWDDRMPKASACLWNTSLLHQMTCCGCHMACVWHSAWDNGVWVCAWFCPQGLDDRSKECVLLFYWHVRCNPSIALAFNITQGAFSESMNITQAWGS